LRDQEQIRAAVQTLDVVTSRRVASILRDLLDSWPEARTFFEPHLELVIAAIKEQQKAERQKWLERA